ncbi:hypothetical protein KCTC32516_00401 [Polaribacter huanghezhanensis]|uniref:hypothetical protein n=1 Tax=Polaribacter huanghezhanensis TaxID=1354726 RepID=UPI002648090F|nr:hypothetical protein [Polaribacter huanghezhanensis]WKD85063.1 hypothetical protein KCTC32516_00401 [Polaribacter huanghezhanensis]
MIKRYIVILLSLLMFSCSVTSNKEETVLNFLKENEITVTKPSLVIILPNNSCSFCVNRIIGYLNEKNTTEKIILLFLESKVLTMLDKDTLEELKAKIKVKNKELDDFIKTGLLVKSDNYYKPLFIEIEKKITIHEIESSGDYQKYYNIINKYY